MKSDVMQTDELFRRSYLKKNHFAVGKNFYWSLTSILFPEIKKLMRVKDRGWNFVL